MTGDILVAARRQLAESGAAALSLRAVARELGLASSALYRYVASRDELLTLLLIDAYDSLGAAAEKAEARVPRGDPRARWFALGRAARRWALAHPHEWALLFGSPVPGFAAPRDTVGPASRLPLLLLGVLTDAATAETGRPLPTAVRADLVELRRQLAIALPEGLLARGLMAWTTLVGAVSFELFGHLHGVIARQPAWFDYQLGLLADDLGLTTTGSDR